MALNMATADRSPRCAIYTRKSVARGLDDEHNTLQVQREICSAYIRSQRHRRWLEIATHYDDGGYSGASLERPALRQLIADIEAGLIDVVVIYKLDRLTRSLADFIRLIDTFEHNGVTFVSVTQSFDTQDSMGRLVLNILLTFAQFEREMIADRIRDKMRQMKKAGRWTGGAPPYGYDLIDKRLVINEREAAEVRALFQRYLEIGSSHALTEECRRNGMTTKQRTNRAGVQIGGDPITSSQIYWMLGNPAYIAVFRVGDEFVSASHKPIIEKCLWDKVQTLRDSRRKKQPLERPHRHLLLGLMYDEFGRRMRVAYDRTSGRDKRYYFSDNNHALTKRGLKALRVSGEDFEQLVVTGLCTFLRNRFALSGMVHNLGRRSSDTDKLVDRGPAAANILSQLDRRRLWAAIGAIIERIELSRERVRVVLASDQIVNFLAWTGTGTFRNRLGPPAALHPVHVLEFDAGAVRQERLFHLATDAPNSVRGKKNYKLIGLLRSARHIQHLVYERRDLTMKQVAAEVKRTPAHTARLLRVNYLAPDIVAAIMDGRQPPTLNGRILLYKSIPTDWVQQRALLGFPPLSDRSPREQPY